MLDRRWLRNNYSEIKTRLEKRGEDLSALTGFGEMDEIRRKIIANVEELKAKRNEASKEISVLKKEKKDASEAISEMQKVSKEIKSYLLHFTNCFRSVFLFFFQNRNF